MREIWTIINVWKLGPKMGLKLVIAGQCEEICRPIITHRLNLISQLNSQIFPPWDFNLCSGYVPCWWLAKPRPTKHAVPNWWFCLTRHWSEVIIQGWSRPDQYVVLARRPKEQRPFSIRLETFTALSTLCIFYLTFVYIGNHIQTWDLILKIDL